MGRQPPEWLVINLLRGGSNWDTSGTFGVKPDISFGGYDETKAQPQVTIGNVDKGPINGGTTGYSGIDPTGGTPHQTIDGVVMVHLWAEDRDIPDSASTDYARRYLKGDEDGSNHGAVEEVRQIIKDNADQPTDPNTSNQPVDRIAPLNDGRVPNDEAGDEVIHYVVEVGFGYFDD